MLARTENFEPLTLSRPMQQENARNILPSRLPAAHGLGFRGRLIGWCIVKARGLLERFMGNEKGGYIVYIGTPHKDYVWLSGGQMGFRFGLEDSRARLGIAMWSTENHRKYPTLNLQQGNTKP